MEWQLWIGPLSLRHLQTATDLLSSVLLVGVESSLPCTEKKWRTWEQIEKVLFARLYPFAGKGVSASSFFIGYVLVHNTTLGLTVDIGGQGKLRSSWIGMIGAKVESWADCMQARQE